jgi:chitin disaccharide deacetylase
MRFLFSFVALICVALVPSASIDVNAQAPAKTLVERLGYPRDTKLLIVHADDLGMAHSVNAATIKGFESGLVNSGSIMVPCPWFPEIAEYARSHAEADLGLHLTLTSEWAVYLWGPVLSKERVPSLFDKRGYLYPLEDIAASNISPEHAEAEIRAQIERAKAYGITPTHLDSHMGTLYQNKVLFDTLLRVARDNRLPVRISKEWLPASPFLPSIIKPEDILIDKIVSIGANVTADRWVDYYVDEIKRMQPGVNEIVIHLAFDDAEMRAVTVNHPDWGSAWRQRDFDFFTSDRFRQLLKEQNIKLITWREIGKLLNEKNATGQ